MILDVSQVCSKLNSDLVTFIHNIVILIKIAVPIVLVLFGMLDLGKGVLASKEDEIKKGQSTFIKRLLAGVVVFFMISIVQLVISLVDKDGDGDIWKCANGILNGKVNYVEKMHNVEYYDDEQEKQKEKDERICKNQQANDEYNRCLNYQSQRICDSIFQNMCIAENNDVLWKPDTSADIDFMTSMLSRYTCEDINSDYKEMYYRALYSCSMGQTKWDEDTCIRYFYPFCKPKSSTDNKKAECCYQAGGIIKSGECTAYYDVSQAGKNQGKGIQREVNTEIYNNCMSN